MKLDRIYGEYLPEYCNYFGRPLILKNSMYGMNNSGKIFAYDLTNRRIDVSGFKQSQFQISIYYKYAPDGSKIVVLIYADDCVFWYTSEELGGCFVDTLGKRFHANFLGYAHWFMPISISQLK